MKSAWRPNRAGHSGNMLLAAALLAALAIALPAETAAEQASQPGALAAGQLDVSGGTGDGSGHTCARLADGVRCWGFGGGGRLGYSNESTIGDDETPGAVGPVDLGLGRSANALSAGAFHTCALLDDKSVGCWGFGSNGRLGYGNTLTVGDDEAPGSAGRVNLGDGRTAEAITAGGAHTCALLDDDNVRCWGFGGDGRLGYGDGGLTIGDDEKPSAAGPVDLGKGSTGEQSTATAISAGGFHTCAVLNDGNVRCWGLGDNGVLGYGNVDTIGRNQAPGSVAPVDLGEGRTATAISAGDAHTCALLDGGDVRCWGVGGNGRLGYANTTTIGDDEKPGSVGPVDLGEDPATGQDRKAKAISAGDNHTCALLDDDSVRCWGFAGDGRLGYGNTNNVGDDEPPGSVGPVDLGSGRTAVAVSAGGRHTCALLDDDSIRCWGFAATGRLGYCNANDIGDDEAPGSVGPVNVTGASECPAAAGLPPASGGAAPAPGVGGGLAPAPAPGVSPVPETGDSRAERRRARYRRALAAQARRRRGLRSCLRVAVRRNPRPARRMRSGARRQVSRRRRAARGRCLRRFGRTPGRVGGLTARARSRSKVVLSFRAPGTHASRPPAARRYVVKQSRRPIQSRRGFSRAQTLCRGRCSFDVTFVGAKVSLTVTGLRPRTTYHYSVAARDNVSGRNGRRSPTAKARTRR